MGQHVAAHLLSAGRHLTATYRTPNPAIEQLQASGGGGGLSLVRLDVSRPDAFSGLPPEIDTVVHIAGATTATGISIDEMLACNVTGTGNVLRYALAARAKRLIHLSTLSVYGAIRQSIVDENTPIVDPDAYGASKYRGEQILAAAAGQLPSVAIRVPGVLGRGAHRAWLPTVLQKVRRGEDVAIFNPDSQFNNAVHVDDLSRFIENLAVRDLTGFSAFPIGAAGSITIRNAVERIVAGANVHVSITVRDEQPSRFTISSDRAIRAFGYRPMEIGAMIDRYVAEFGIGEE